MSSRRVSTNAHNYQATNRKREEIGEVYILSFFAASAFKNVLKKFFSRHPKPKPKSSPNFVAKKKLTSALWTPSWFPKTRRTFVSYLSGDLSSVANNSKRLVFSRRRPLAPRRSFLSPHPGAGYSLTFAVVCLCTKKKKLKGSVQSVSSESSAEKTLALEAAACVRFSTFKGVFVIFQSQSHPDRRTRNVRTLRAFAKQRRRSIAQIFSQQHIERSTLSLSKENIKRTQPYLAFFRWGCKETLLLSVAEMTRRKTGKKSIFQFFFFRTFLRWCSKNYTQDTTTLDSRNSRRRESKSCPRLISRGGVSPRGVVLFNAFFFFFRCEELRKFFFLFEAWSLVARVASQVWVSNGKTWRLKNFSPKFRVLSKVVLKLEGRGGLHFIFLLCEEGVQCVFVLWRTRVSLIYICK